MQFTNEFHTALNAEQAAFRALEAHWQSNPVKWKFWKRPSADWEQLEAQLKESYKQACLALSELKDAQTPGRKVARYKALKFGGISSMIFFAGILGLVANQLLYDGQVNWMAGISTVMAGFGTVVLMCAFIFAE